MSTTTTCGALLKTKLINFIVWLKSLGLDTGSTLEDIRNTNEVLVVAAVQEALWEQKAIVAQRDLSALCLAMQSDTDDFRRVIEGFKSASRTWSDEEMTKFWRYIDLFVLLVE